MEHIITSIKGPVLALASNLLRSRKIQHLQCCVSSLFGILFYCLGYLIVGEIKRSPNVIIKQDSEYMWVKEYSLYNEDFCVYKYHQPIIYEGIVVDRRSHFQGVPGKGGHRVYRTDIRYNGNVEHTETGWSYYDSHKEGDKVKVKVSFYPWEKIEVLN